MNQLELKVVTPERVVLDEPVDEVTTMTESGEITVLPGHVPLVTALTPGEMRVKEGGKEWYLAVSTGFLEVRPGNQVVVLADTAERSEELDLAKIEEMREKAKALLEEKRRMGSADLAAAAGALERELARAKVARRRPPAHGGHLPHV